LRSLVPGQFTGAVVRAGGGELEAQLSQGGNWQVKVRFADEPEWRLLCVGNLDGRVLAPSVPAKPQARVKIGSLSIDFVRRQVEVKGKKQGLRAREFDLLAVLASEPGRLFTKDELLMEVWGHPTGASRSTRTLDSHVSSIRCKLRQAGIDGFLINYRGVGFKLCEGVAIKP
jgi:DNA-binding response OmpR family regulator